MSFFEIVLLAGLSAVPFGVLFVWLLHLSDRAIDKREQRKYRKNYLKYLDEKYPNLKETEN